MLHSALVIIARWQTSGEPAASLLNESVYRQAVSRSVINPDRLLNERSKEKWIKEKKRRTEPALQL